MIIYKKGLMRWVCVVVNETKTPPSIVVDDARKTWATSQMGQMVKRRSRSPTSSLPPSR